MLEPQPQRRRKWSPLNTISRTSQAVAANPFEFLAIEEIGRNQSCWGKQQQRAHMPHGHINWSSLPSSWLIYGQALSV